LQHFERSFAMRLLFFALVLLSIPLASLSLNAQDLTQQMLLNQQTVQDQQTQQNIQTQQQMTDQQTQLLAQQDEATAMQPPPVYSPAMAGGIWVAPPRFSLKAGTYHHPLRVRISDPTRNTVVYYTTDGWTPTVLSRRYIGPISVPSTVTLQAVALLNGFVSSTVTTVTYTIPGSVHQEPRVVLAGRPIADPALDNGAGPHVRLAFTKPVVSQGLQVGDDLPVVLKHAFRGPNGVIVPKGTPVLATVTQTDRPGFIGAPAEIAFNVWSLKANGEIYPLAGSRTMQGADHQHKARYLAMIPYVGFAGLLVRGGEAVIPEGATFTASIESPKSPPADNR
jgi:hypothetical protein